MRYVFAGFVTLAFAALIAGALAARPGGSARPWASWPREQRRTTATRIRRAQATRARCGGPLKRWPVTVSTRTRPFTWCCCAVDSSTTAPAASIAHAMPSHEGPRSPLPSTPRRTASSTSGSAALLPIWRSSAKSAISQPSYPPRRRRRCRQSSAVNGARSSPAALGRRFLTERPGAGCDVVGRQRRELVRPDLVEPFRESQRMRVQCLLEQRPREARIAEPLAALRSVEDPTQRFGSPAVEAVFAFGGELLRDCDQFVRRIVRERDLAREARLQPRVGLEKAAHQRRIAGDDHDEAVAVVLHPLQQRLDRLGAEVLPPLVPSRERVRLVDEEHAVESALDRAIRLDRRRPDVLPHEAGAVDLDEVAALQQSHRAVHLRKQPGDRRLARAGVAEEDEVLARRDFGEPVLLPSRLHLEKCDQRAHLLLHRVQPDQRVELGLQLIERTRRFRPLRHSELIREIVADGLADALAERAQSVRGVLERIAVHGGKLPAQIEQP